MTPGVVIDGKYRVLRKIGEGGMASVYEAENMRLGNRVALKKMHGSLKSHEANVERFRKEAAALSAVSHPNIVRILDVVEVDGVPILVMELLEGRTLGELLKVNGRPPSNELDRLARQMLSALAHLHQRGYTHRDIKPENIFFHRLSSHEAVYRLMDFGVAQEGVDHSMTSTGLFVGTRRYASPEQIRNPKGVDHRSDLYSLGVTLWQCATGRTPHEGVETEFEMMRAITEQPNFSVSDGLVDGTLVQLIEKLTANDPNQRFVSAEEALNFLGTGEASVAQAFAQAPSPAQHMAPAPHTAADSPYVHPSSGYEQGHVPRPHNMSHYGNRSQGNAPHQAPGSQRQESSSNPWDALVRDEPRKSVGMGVLLAIVFGPFGLAYTSWVQALWWALGSIVFTAITGGFGIILVWVAIPFVAAGLVTEYNQKHGYND